MELLWRVELENGATVTGSTLMQPGENRIVCDLPDDTLKSVTGAMLWDTEPGERIFINTGSRPFVPPVPGMAESPYCFTSETLMERGTVEADGQQLQCRLLDDIATASPCEENLGHAARGDALV